jgi:hypothetical protein
MLDQLHEIANLPKAVRNASGHSLGDAKRLMDADKVVIHHVERDRVGRGSRSSLRPHGQTGEAPRVHPDGEVLALDEVRRDTSNVRCEPRQRCGSRKISRSSYCASLPSFPCGKDAAVPATCHRWRSQ